MLACVGVCWRVGASWSACCHQRRQHQALTADHRKKRRPVLLCACDGVSNQSRRWRVRVVLSLARSLKTSRPPERDLKTSSDASRLRPMLTAAVGLAPLLSSSPSSSLVSLPIERRLTPARASRGFHAPSFADRSSVVDFRHAIDQRIESSRANGGGLEQALALRSSVQSTDYYATTRPRTRVYECEK